MTHSLLLRPDRLAALRQTALLDTPPEEGFDRLTRMAARLLGAPTSLISLVTDERQFFKSTTGLPEPWATRRTAPLSFSFCSTVTGTGEPLVVEDARRHPLLRHSQALRDLGWVSYAGVPLVSRDGHVLGSFCVVDRTPRLWSERDIALLQDLAASAVTEIELRREMAQRGQAELGRRDNEEQLYSTFEHAGVGMALLSLDGRWIRVNRALADLLGSSPEQLIGFPAETRTHPEDLAAEQEAMRLLLVGEESKLHRREALSDLRRRSYLGAGQRFPGDRARRPAVTPYRGYPGHHRAEAGRARDPGAGGGLPLGHRRFRPRGPSLGALDRPADLGSRDGTSSRLSVV